MMFRDKQVLALKMVNVTLEGGSNTMTTDCEVYCAIGIHSNVMECFLFYSLPYC